MSEVRSRFAEQVALVTGAAGGIGSAVAARFAAQHFEQRIPLRRVGQPRDVAAVVAFLASADAAHVTGVGWLIDRGQTLQSWSNAPHAVAYPKQHATRDDRSPDPPWRYS